MVPERNQTEVGSPADEENQSQHPEVQAARSINSILLKLYISHFLSTWNSRMFEFAAVLFLAVITPGTLLYASIYALLRSLAAALLSARIGAYIDRTNRLTAIRASIVWQRLPVALSCLLFAALLVLPAGGGGVFFGACFAGSVALACVEKLAAVGNTIAVERDWVVVLSASLGADRRRLNATMRRIDLLCKLVAPVFVSLVQGYYATTVGAVLLVLGLNLASVLVEYFAIARVYHAVPELGRGRAPGSRGAAPVELEELLGGEDRDEPVSEIRKRRESFSAVLAPWKSYFTAPVFLASFSLSILYLTVLSTGVQYQTYMLSIGYSSIAVSLLRLAAVVSELMATCLAPLLAKRIGGIRSGLWSINWQVLWLAVAVVTFEYFENDTRLAGAVLTVGIVVSRLGLWGFDLAVQDIVQEGVPASQRGAFSASEAALQNVFELLSFASTIVFPKPSQFRYPVAISLAAIMLSACCFAGFVRKERGHLLHMSKCMKREKHDGLEQFGLGDNGSLDGLEDERS